MQFHTLGYRNWFVLIYILTPYSLTHAFEILTLNPGDSEREKYEHIIDAEKIQNSKENPKRNLFFSQSKQILLLGDGFEEIYEKTSLAGPIQKVVPNSVTVWKTDFSCPKQEYRKGYRQMKVDHKENFEFKSNAFDKIIMRQGLCVCDGTSHTCGGVNAEKKDALRFMQEIARVLNKNNESAMAYLHGPHRNPKAEEFRRVELSAEEVWKYAANALEIDYPGIEVKLIYFNSPVLHRKPAATSVSSLDNCKVTKIESSLLASLNSIFNSMTNLTLSSVHNNTHILNTAPGEVMEKKFQGISISMKKSSEKIDHKDMIKKSAPTP